jgi:hypothetical protein
MVSGPLGEAVFADNLAGPGFGVSFIACAETVCLRTSPGDGSRVVAPGSTFKPTLFSPTPGFAPFQFYDGGTATILGVTYAGSGSQVPGPNSVLFLAGASPLAFDATFEAPPFLPGSPFNTTLTAPFSFSGELVLGVAGEFPNPFFDLHLSGQGIATINLVGGICSQSTPDLCGWFVNGSSYDFSPVPEPASLFLLGTALTGMRVLAARLRRR